MKRTLLLLLASCLSFAAIAQTTDPRFQGTYEKKVVQTFNFSDGTIGKKIWLNKYTDGKPFYINSTYFSVSTGSTKDMQVDVNGWYGASTTGRFYSGKLPDWQLVINVNTSEARQYYLERVEIDCYYPDMRDKHLPEMEKNTPGTFTKIVSGQNKDTWQYTPNQYWFSTLKINISWMYRVKSVMLVLKPKPEKLVKSVPDETFTVNGVQFTMIGVPGGKFLMGPDPVDKTNSPAHYVTLSDYLIGETEVTQALWKAVMGDRNNPSPKKADTLPVHKILYEEAQNFARRLSQLTGREFYVPAEAQWEYAALGGPFSQGYIFSGSNIATDVGWARPKSNSPVLPVKTKRPNELGIYDMTGNVMEWVSDPSGRYPTYHVTDPQVGLPWGSEADSYYVLRGQLLNNTADYGVKRRYSAVINEDWIIKVLQPGLRIALKPKK